MSRGRVWECGKNPSARGRRKLQLEYIKSLKRVSVLWRVTSFSQSPAEGTSLGWGKKQQFIPEFGRWLMAFFPSFYLLF